MSGIDNEVSQPLLVFSDLDGTLLDHHSYSFEPALDAIAQLKARSIPIIINTSKTYLELLDLRSDLKISDPFIVENGAAIFLPCDYFAFAIQDAEIYEDFIMLPLVKAGSHWRELIKAAASEVGASIELLSEMKVERIVELTGLNSSQAALAKQRQFGEPIHWLGTSNALEKFEVSMRAHGANVNVGGRFVHVSGKCEKGRAMNRLTELYDKARGNRHQRVALGDGKNDLPMLEQAEYSVAIRSPVNGALDLSTITSSTRARPIYSTSACGPSAWVEGLMFFNIIDRN